MKRTSFWKHDREWSADTSDATVELVCYKEESLKPFGPLPAWKHLLAAAYALYTARQFYRHRWTEFVVERWCAHDWLTIWGGGACGKSTIIAMCIVLDWIAAPHETTINLCSTTQKMLRKRIWGEVTRYYLMHDFPGELVRSQDQIVLRAGDDDAEESPKNGIFGLGVMRDDGTLQLSNIVGMHNSRNRFIVDELQGTPEAVLKALDNLSLGGASFKFTGLGNPMSWEDPLGQESEPVSGIESIDISMEEWPTKHGHCIRLDGEKSPAIIEPGGAAKYPGIVQAGDLQKLRERRGSQSAEYMMFGRGWMPPQGTILTVFTHEEFKMFRVDEPVRFLDTWQMFAGCDPSFVEGGDDCMVSFAKVGRVTSGMIVVVFTEDVIITVDKWQKDRPFSYAQAEVICTHCAKRQVTAARYAQDCTGAQAAHADIVETTFGGDKIHRVDFSGAPTARPVNAQDPTPANAAYDRRVTELWYAVHEFMRSGQLRGMSPQARKEACSRRLTWMNRRRSVETKRDMKRRIGYSPDNMDSKAVLIDMLRERYNIHPGGRIERERSRDRGDRLKNLGGIYVSESFAEEHYL